MTLFLVAFITNLIDFFIVDKYYSCFARKKRNSSVNLIFLLSCTLILSFINMVGKPNLNLICSITLIFLYGINYILPLKYYFVLPVLYMGIGFVTEPVGILLHKGLTGIFLFQSETIIYFISVLLCEWMRLLIVIIVKNYWNGQLMDLPFNVNILLCSVPIIGVICCCVAIRIVWLYENPEENILCAGIIFSILFSNVFVFTAFQKLSSMFKEIHNKEMLLQEAKLKEEYYREVDNAGREIRKIRHDLKNRLSGIYSIEGNETLMKNKIKEILGDLENSSKNLYTANRILNTILNIKYKEAQLEHIVVENHILVPQYINIDYGDMGVLFGNLLDNAIEACKGLPEDKRWIKFSANYMEHILVLKIKNSKKNGTEIKKDKSNHGIGLKSVQQVLEKYNGIAEVNDLGTVFEVSAILYGIHNNIEI